MMKNSAVDSRDNLGRVSANGLRTNKSKSDWQPEGLDFPSRNSLSNFSVRKSVSEILQISSLVLREDSGEVCEVYGHSLVK